jgi:hypothetical protein
MKHRHSSSHLFTLRLWQEELGAGRPEWRGRVQHVLSSDARHFRDWPSLVVHLQDMLRTLELEGDEDDGTL